MMDIIIKEAMRIFLEWGNRRDRYPLYPEFLVFLLGILHLFHLRKGSNYFLTSKAASPISQLRGFSRDFFVPLYTDADESVIQSFHSRANRSSFPIRSPPKKSRDTRVKKYVDPSF